ncbi:MAG: hypothetical protein ABIT10_02990 [Alteraurantiacibacter sp.]
MSLADLSEHQIDAFIANYVSRGLESGGKYALAELKLERLRRVKSPFSPAETARVIVDLARKSNDGLVTYKEVWSVFRPNATWIGNAPRAEMAKALAAVIVYCVDKKLPILTTLVVLASSRNHSTEAIENIYKEAKSLGVETGSNAPEFVKEQQCSSLALSNEVIP